MDKRGVGGVHTDLPSFLIVVIAVSLFLASSGRVLLLREGKLESDRTVELCDDIIKFMMRYGKLVTFEGCVNPWFAQRLDNETLKLDLQWVEREWSISLEWNGGYYSWNSGGNQESAFVRSGSVSILDSLTYGGLLTVGVSNG